MNEFMKKVGKLIDVKSIITLSFTITFLIICFNVTKNAQTVPAELTDNVKMIIIFYFGTQVGKNTAKQKEDTNP